MNDCRSCSCGRSRSYRKVERRLGEHSKRSPSFGWSLQLGVKPRRGARNRRLKLNQQLSLEVACNTVQGLTKGLRA